MSLTGGKRKVNKSLKAWVAFVKKVQREEKLSYKDAIHRAKIRKDKGEKWMIGGDPEIVEDPITEEPTATAEAEAISGEPTAPAAAQAQILPNNFNDVDYVDNNDVNNNTNYGSLGGGKRRRRTMRRSRGRGRGRGRTARRSRGRASRRH